MTNPTENNQASSTVATIDPDRETSGAAEGSFEVGEQSRPEDIIIQRRNDKIIYAEGLQLDPDNANPIIAEMARIEQTDDLKQSQIAIAEYEAGNAPLYRTLNRLLKLGESFIATSDAVVKNALINLKQLLTEEAASAKKSERENRGFKNIGIPKLPPITDELIGQMRKETLEVFKLIVQFYFPNAKSGPRARYYIVLNFAHVNAIPNFVMWLAGDHEYTENNVKKIGTGIAAAYNKAQFLARGPAQPPAIKTDNELEKAFITNMIYTTKKPDWLDVKEEKFFILARVKEGDLQIVNVISSDPSQMKSAVKARYGSLFPSDFNLTIGDRLAKLRDAIKYIVKYTGTSELILWQEHWTTYLMATNEQWKSDSDPRTIKTDSSLHYPIALEVHPFLEKPKLTKDENKSDVVPNYAQFKEFTCLPQNEEDDYESDIFGVGYVTSQIDELSKFSGEPYLVWEDDDHDAFFFMGVRWKSSDNRKPKPRTREDEAAKRTRLPSCLPHGFKYIMACSHYQEGTKLTSGVISQDIDFMNAKLEYKKWIEARTSVSIPSPKEVIICVRNGVIGIWYEPVSDASGKIIYNIDKQLVKIGTVTLETLEGQWRIPYVRLSRVWDLITSGWQLMVPEYITSVKYFEEPNMDIECALSIMEGGEHHPFGHMRNLCSSHEHDDGVYEVYHERDVEPHPDGMHMMLKAEQGGGEPVSTIQVRMCFPFVLRCHQVMVYIPAETR